MIPLAIPVLSGNEARYLQDCVTTGFVSSVGPFVSRFEAMIAESTGAASAFATSSGTVGLHLALTAAGVRPGDLVIAPSYTFIASANAVAHCGASPWIVDIAADTWTLDPTLVATALQTETRRENGACIHRATGRRVAAIMPVHVLGLAADMDPIVATAREHDLKVIADAACALGALYKGEPVARMGADLSVISFNGNKTVTAGGGGGIVGNDAELTDRARHLGTTARKGPGYDHDAVGFNYRMTNLQAALGCAQMERLADLLLAKRRIRDTYDRAFAGLPDLIPFPRGNGTDNACWLSGVLAADAAAANEIRARLADAGVEAKPFWKPVHLQTPYRDAPRTAQTVSDSIWQRVVTLPCSADLTDSDQSHVISAVKGSRS